MKKIELRSSSQSLARWTGILIFVGIPWLIILLLKPVPDILDEFDEKLLAFEGRPNFDTVIIGDSRVLRIKEDEFSERGWVFFNMGLPGLSAADIALTLNFTLDQRPIQRVIIGASFENMTEFKPFEFSRYATRYANVPFYSMKEIYLFNDIEEENIKDLQNTKKKDMLENKIKRIFINSNGLQEIIDKIVNKIKSELNAPIRQASNDLHMFLNIFGIKKLVPTINPDGTAIYTKIQEEIKNGKYDFIKNRHVQTYWERPDGEIRYLEKGKLSENSKKTYQKVFNILADRGIPVIIFETPRLPAYQQRINSNELLNHLQEEWRNFYRKQENNCIRFLDYTSIEEIIDPNDFFDATHFIGVSENRLAAKLALELSSKENSCSKKF